MKKNKTKYIFVVGGVMSGVGKGITSSSLAAIMQARGFRTTAIKIDPYINVDAGTMNPTEHGEVFVLGDGDECDQDMGNYERFLDTDLSRTNYMTTGRVYLEVIRRERNLEYEGKNVEVVPDIPKEVIRRIERAGREASADVVVVEIGGTIGEYQNIIFLEAGRMMKTKYPDDVAFVMVSYLPIPSKVGEMKTKPTQYASRSLNSVGVQADVIIARSEMALDKKRKDKIATFCNIVPERVISAPDIDSIYEVPINFERDRLGEIMCQILKLGNHRTTELTAWKKLVRQIKTVKRPLNIAIVGKYFDSGEFVLSDVYISVIEALKLSAYQAGVKPVLSYVNSKDIETGKRRVTELAKYDGIIVPGGFGTAGIEGLVKVIKFAREKKIPYFGLCYGMQLLVIEYARHKAGVPGATSREIDPTASDLVIDVMEEQKKNLADKNYGGTMRLGSFPAYLKKGTLARGAYKAEMVTERHRHRYEVNPAYIERLEKAGLVFSGTSPSGQLMEIAELPKTDHPFFLGTQFHPEFLARPLRPHPLFSEFVKAAKDHHPKTK
ncbi:MAG: CTP synthase [Candidatus Vogelbacteria bacterium RIFOXYD1_FULL_46_19]|uniref:CTP synthase n=1 Tax=Candidatus Vogelbacteria bacterium RIFOXYD1_FULL_46_19 TaxID=1802439 RepID=A0A1G2QIP8_9BACT|nr:MAG: CTP synthase [Candidatus Vogelbacteria bacterium RIFOXYD1_FULL_46_19]